MRLALTEGSPGGERELACPGDPREALRRRDELAAVAEEFGRRRVYFVIDLDRVDGAPDAPVHGTIEWCEECGERPAYAEADDGLCVGCAPPDQEALERAGQTAAFLFGRVRCGNCGDRFVARSRDGRTSRPITERALLESACHRCGRGLVLDVAYLSSRA